MWEIICKLDASYCKVGSNVVQVTPSLSMRGFVFVQDGTKFELFFNEYTFLHSDFIKVASDDYQWFFIGLENAVEDPLDFS